MDIKATDIVVTGRVQGVFYRAGMREQAERLEVAGWVHNEPDGTVTAHLEGAPGSGLRAARLVCHWHPGSPGAGRLQRAC